MLLKGLLIFFVLFFVVEAKNSQFSLSPPQPHAASCVFSAFFASLGVIIV